MFFILTLILVSIFVFFFIQYYKTRINVIGINIIGGLGNILFQFAFIYSLARDSNCKFTIIGIQDYQNPHSNTDLQFIKKRIITLPNYVSTFTQTPVQIQEFNEFKCDKYKTDLHENLNFTGYYQTEKYFSKYRKEILEILKEPSHVTCVLDSSDIDFDNGFFLHIRLTDFGAPHKVSNSTQMVSICLSMDYYEKCIQLLPIHIQTIYVFSDDIPGAENILQSIDKNFIFISDLNEIETLYSMARMKYGGICANSTFSWWGSWLNNSPNKLIYMPKPWLTTHNCVDIYPSYATIIQYENHNFQKKLD